MLHFMDIKILNGLMGDESKKKNYLIVFVGGVQCALLKIKETKLHMI